jgi:hypothetical protein
MKLFVKKDFLEYVCDQNNLYNNQVISAASSTSTKNSLLQTWIPTTVLELKASFGIVCVRNNM